jgi:uncharacterized membrane protein
MSLSRKSIAIIIGLSGIAILYNAYLAGVLVPVLLIFVATGLLVAAPDGLVERLDNRFTDND